MCWCERCYEWITAANLFSVLLLFPNWCMYIWMRVCASACIIMWLWALLCHDIPKYLRELDTTGVSDYPSPPPFTLFTITTYCILLSHIITSSCVSIYIPYFTYIWLVVFEPLVYLVSVPLHMTFSTHLCTSFSCMVCTTDASLIYN